MPTSLNIGPRRRRARVWREALILLLAGLFAAFPAAAQTQRQDTTKPQFEGPRASIQGRDIDVGTVSRGELIEHTFTVTNVGSETLKILRAESGCECSVASYDEEIAPGGSGKLSVQVDTATFYGQIGKGVTLTTNDRYTPTTRVVIRALVLASVEVYPGRQGSVTNRGGAGSTKEFLVRPAPTENGVLLVQRAGASVDWIEVDAERVTERRNASASLPVVLPGDWIVRATLRPDAPAGRYRESVVFGTGLPREPQITLDLSADVVGPIMLNVDEIRLVAGETLTLLAARRPDVVGHPIDVSAPEGLIVRTEQPQQDPRGRYFRIHLDWQGAPPAEPVKFKLQLGEATQTFAVNVVAAN